MIERTVDGGVACLRFAHGKVSALDLEFLVALEEAFTCERDTPERALVVTGTGSSFCAGVDLARLVQGSAADTHRFLRALDGAFRALFTLPKPVVAALNGHAIAGGCLLAWCADHVLLAEGRGRVGVPELAVGVPFPPLALEIARARLAAPDFRRVVLHSETCSPEDALALGLVDALAPADELLQSALEVATRLGEVPSEAFSLTKALLREPSLERVARQDAAYGVALDAAWTSPAVLDAVRRKLASLQRPG